MAIDELRSAMQAGFKALENRLVALDNRLVALDNRVVALDNRVTQEGATTRRHFDVVGGAPAAT